MKEEATRHLRTGNILIKRTIFNEKCNLLPRPGGDAAGRTPSVEPAGVGLFRHYLSPAAKAAIPLPSYVLEVITGMLLGDSCLSKPTSTEKSQLMVEQENLSFVKYIWDIFNSVNIVGALPSTRSRYDKRTGNTYTSSRFNTFTLPLLAALFYEWYTIIDGHSIKHLPVNIFDLLTPVSIAFWLASDGHYSLRDGVIYIATDSFTLTEVQLLQSILFEKFDILTTINNNGSGKEQYRLRVRKSSISKLQSLIRPHIPPMMAYRVGL